MKNMDFEKEGGYKLFESVIINKKDFLWEKEFTKEDVKNCWKILADDADAEKGKFEEKIKKQFGEKTELSVKQVLVSNAEYLFMLGVAQTISKSTKQERAMRWAPEEKKPKDTKFVKGFGASGTKHFTDKYWSIRFLFVLFYDLIDKIENGKIEKNVKNVKEEIEKICASLANRQGGYFIEKNVFGPEASAHLDDKNYLSERQLPMYNILLHLVNPEKHERIISYAQKKQLVNAFSILLNDDEKNKPREEKIEIIHKKIQNSLNKDFDFYDEVKVAKIWYGGENQDMDLLQALRYKKAIVLYGPPGTSKTFSAHRLATSFVLQEKLKSDLKNSKTTEEKVKIFNNYLASEDEKVKGCIHYLQLHPNYQYEDFVAGIKLNGQEMKPMKGAIFAFCDEAAAAIKQEIPHVVILDEINRVDLTRLFGEVFSALEERGKDKEIYINGEKFCLNIPDNLYFIGTMNQIDFSLERLDFALRRRFLWFFHGYEQEVLCHMINQKMRKYEINVEKKEIERFCNNATELNKEIENNENWGKAYQIGHTFFAEIMDIIHYMAEEDTNKPSLYKSGAADILWKISIRPQLEAMLGNMNDKDKEEKIKKFENIFNN